MSEESTLGCPRTGKNHGFWTKFMRLKIMSFVQISLCPRVAPTAPTPIVTPIRLLGSEYSSRYTGTKGNGLKKHHDRPTHQQTLAHSIISPRAIRLRITHTAPFPFLPDLSNVPSSTPPLQFPASSDPILLFLFPDEFSHDSIDSIAMSVPRPSLFIVLLNNTHRETVCVPV